MAQKLTNSVNAALYPQKLTSNNNSPFLLGLKYKLETGYTFKEMQVSDNKKLQKFLDLVSQLSVYQVDNSYARKPDLEDIYEGKNVRHYEVSKGFRIHVILENGIYFIIRLDPNHSVHN